MPRRRWSAAVVVLFLSVPALAAGGSPDATPPPAALDKLAASVDRLVGLLEREVALRADERDARRVEVALGILELRSKKVERIEGEIQQIDRDELESTSQLNVMRARADQLGKQVVAANGEAPDAIKQDLAMIEARVKTEEDRLASMRERRGALQNDAAAERRRMAGVEAMLDAWLEKQ